MTLETRVDALLAGRYRLEERIAVGGMGEVWRATDTVLGRVVAVKTLRPEFVGDADFRARFRAEAQHCARLSHPGIAAVYDFGETPDGAWLVMELVDGEPLSTLLRRERVLPTDRVLDVVAQTAAALQAAHDGGVVHRDVKPGNLLVRPDGVVKVTDFGIAFAAGSTPLTQTGQLVGTALYVSPEQASGRQAGPASDLYSLGVVAFECLSGARPFPGEHPVAVVLAHLNDPPPDLPAEVPPAVVALVQQLLAKDPADRPATAGELAATAATLRERLTEGPDALLPVAPPIGARAATAGAPTAAMTAATGLPADPLRSDPARPGPLSAADLPGLRAGRGARPGATPRGQRQAVRGIAVLLAVLALGFGLRSALTGPTSSPDVVVPTLPAGASEALADDRLADAGLRAVTTRQSSATVAAGQVIELRPAAGTAVDAASSVTVVVSSGRPPVTVTAASLVGRPAAQVRDELSGKGLVPRLAYDGKGTAIGTVASVEPVGAVAVGREVVLHVVPEPPPVVVAPAPAPEPAAGEGKGAKGKGQGK